MYPSAAPLPYSLSWSEADPARHPFDAGSGAEAVRALAPEGDPSADPRGWVEVITRALVAEFGSWASGWRWSVGEGDVDGGGRWRRGAARAIRSVRKTTRSSGSPRR